MSMAPTLERLIALLKHRGYAQYRPDKPFTLASGQQSPFYFDIRSAMLDGLCLPEIQDAIYSLAVCNQAPTPDFIGSVDTAGRSLVPMLIQQYMRRSYKAVHGFVVRKNKKDHGTMAAVDGVLPTPGSKVLIVDDVVTTGSSIRQVYDVACGCDVREIRSLCILARLPRSYQDLPAHFGTSLQFLLHADEIFPEFKA